MRPGPWPALPLLFLFVACRGADAPSQPPGGDGEECARGGRPVRACAPPLQCREEPFLLPTSSPVRTMRTADIPSGENETCGGIASFHCLKGLACDMTADQLARPDGIGTCVRTSTCRR